MQEKRFPGPPEESGETFGPSEEDKKGIRENEKFMKELAKLSEEYDGSFDIVF